MTNAFIQPPSEEEAANFIEQEALLIDINNAVRAHAEVIIDLQDMGAMYRYVMATRANARDAVMEIMRADPHDAVRIAQLQAVYQKWTDVIEHIAAVRDDAEAAENATKEIFDADEEVTDPQ